MKKFNVLLFTIILLGFSLYGLWTNSFYIQILINISTPYVYARIALAAVLLIYVFVPSLRLYTTKALVGVGGFLLLSIGLISVGSPSLLGYTNSYMLLGDTVTLIEGGILSIVLSAELSARRTQFTAKIFGYVRSQFAGLPKAVAYTRIANSAVQDTALVQYLKIDKVASTTSKHLIKTYTAPLKAPL